jgi:hypothetical protein
VHPSAGETDRHPVLFTRAWPKGEIVEGFDEWQRTKHIPELVLAPGVVSAAYYRLVTEDVPEALQSFGLRMAAYTGRDLPGLYAFVSSEETAAAVADGSGWFDRFNELDFAPYTGNVYTVDCVARADGAHAGPELPLLVERFEVDPPSADVFDDWLRHEHVHQMAELPGAVRARTFSAVREGIPIPYYYSPGNRMLAVEFADLAGLYRSLSGDALWAAIEDSMRWDRCLGYVKRELFEHVLHSYSAHEGAY